jgi:hypothetical protein
MKAAKAGYTKAYGEIGIIFIGRRMNQTRQRNGS